MYTVRLDPVPGPGPCTHDYRGAGYKPGPVLRRLAEVRDGACMLPGNPETRWHPDLDHPGRAPVHEETQDLPQLMTVQRTDSTTYREYTSNVCSRI
jgi:hypothetical protein